MVGTPGAKFGQLGEADDLLKLPAVANLSGSQPPLTDKAKSSSVLPKQTPSKFTKNLKGNPDTEALTIAQYRAKQVEVINPFTTFFNQKMTGHKMYIRTDALELTAEIVDLANQYVLQKAAKEAEQKAMREKEL